MSPNEFAFLALGLVLGAAVGAAIVIVVSSRPVTREVRLTVEHDAVPRRSTTLSSDAFGGAPGEVARGGPADRRAVDRDFPATSDRPWVTPGGPATGWPAAAVAPAAWVRTPVRYAAGPTGLPGTTAMVTSPATGIPIMPEPDPDLETLRVRAAVAAARASGAGHLTATALLERRTAVGTITQETAAETVAPLEPEPLPAGVPPLVGLLRGHHPTLVAATRAIAGEDAVDRRRWGALLVILADGLRDAAIRAGALEFPADQPFWMGFSPDQRRDIAAALASTGHRFDGRGGWADDRVPLHRDLTMAVADAGLEPGRIRHWPDADATRALLSGARVAADVYVTERAPTLEVSDVREILGTRATSLADLWAGWDRVRVVLLGEDPGMTGTSSAG